MDDYIAKSLSYEELGVGVINESNLHYQIKRAYKLPGDRFEVKIDGNIVDIVRDSRLIEIQTRNFKAIRNKIIKFLPMHDITLVYPIAIEKWITTTNEAGEIVRRRKSTKKGELIDMFRELVSIADLICDDKFSLDVIMIKEEELRCDDGKGSWRRKGISIINRNLIEIIDIITFRSAVDYRNVLPKNLCDSFSNNDLAMCMNIKIEKVRRITYCLKKMNIIEKIGKKGRENLFRICDSDNKCQRL